MTLQDVLDGFTWAVGGGLGFGLIAAVAYNTIFRGRN
ncbi:hypothetical protein FHS15_005798 [Paenibacillus castaneae]|nr:hypothetical protein [Paenibacillus castaneae]